MSQKSPNLAIVGIIITVMAQFATMIWWGATLTAGVASLRDAISEFKGSVAVLSQQMTAQVARMAVLETKMDYIRAEQPKR